MRAYRQPLRFSGPVPFRPSLFRPLRRYTIGLAVAGIALVAAATSDLAQAQAPGPGSAAAAAQAGNVAIAAVVNEDVITFYDVQARMGLFMATSGMDPTPEMQRRLVPQVIQALIDERLKLQEAKRLKINISDDELRQTVEMVEAQNGMQPGSFRKMLAERNVDMATLYNQFEGEVAWARVVRQELRREVNVAPEEVKTVLTKLKANQGKPENLLSEIFLPVSGAIKDTDARQVAERLVQRARSGTPFAALAQQFSQSPTAAVGGDLGWVLHGDMEEEVDRALTSMEPKEISEPIRTGSGYHIVQLRERRNSGAVDPFMAIVTLSQIYLPTVGGRAPSNARLAQLTDAITTQVKSCEHMNQWARQIGGPGSGPMEVQRIGALPAPVRDGIVNLQVGQVSKPITMPGARVFMMICTRQDDSGLPSEEQIYAKLEGDKLESAARQKLRDLRRSALIDVRV